MLLPDWQQRMDGDTVQIMAAIKVERMDHVAIDVTDMDRARAFYVGLLGLREIARPASFDFPGHGLRPARPFFTWFHEARETLRDAGTFVSSCRT